MFVGSTEAPSKVFLLFFLLPDWLKLNHLKSRMECGFSDIFSRHFCSTVAETIGVTIATRAIDVTKIRPPTRLRQTNTSRPAHLTDLE